MLDHRFLTTRLFHLGDDLSITSRVNDADFWADRARPELAAGRVVSVFRYTATWDYQERHPTGDELVILLEGEADLLVHDAHGEYAVRLARGGAYVIPTGCWHRVAVRDTATLLFVTPVPARTEHRSAS